VYRFGIFMSEPIMCDAPFEGEDLRDVAAKVMVEEKEPYRPLLNGLLPNDLVVLMHLCWAHKPSLRPAMAAVTDTLRRYYDKLCKYTTLNPVFHADDPSDAAIKSWIDRHKDSKEYQERPASSYYRNAYDPNWKNH